MPALKSDSKLTYIDLIESLFAAVLILFSLTLTRTHFFLDDAAFYFKYVENIVAGNGWRFNASDAPIWGASAPLWPAIIAILVRLGLSIPHAAIICGISFTTAAVILLGRLAKLTGGVPAFLALVIWSACNLRLTFLATQGLESALSYFVIAISVLALKTFKNPLLIGLISGICVIHKLDMAPLGMLLLLAVAVRDKKPPIKAACASLAIAMSWYGFAHFYFGSALPHSFQIKFHTAGATLLPYYWFVHEALFTGISQYLLAVSICSTPFLWRLERPLLLMCWGFIIIQTLAYTVRAPSEPFIWYVAPIQVFLILLSAIGLGQTYKHLRCNYFEGSGIAKYFSGILIVAVAGLGLIAGYPTLSYFMRFVDHYEADRTHAGEWINEHAPKMATIASYYGNPAFFSKRFTYDLSFLNQSFKKLDDPQAVLATYKPDILVDCPVQSGVKAEDYRAPEGFFLAKYFNTSQSSGFSDFFCAIAVREQGIANGMPMEGYRNAEMIRNLIRFGKEGNADAYMKGGWSSDEQGLTWTDGNVASMTFIPGKLKASSIRMTITASAFEVTGKLNGQNVDFFVNGKLQASHTFTTNAEDFSFSVAKEIVASRTVTEVDLLIPTAKPTTDYGGTDPRSLGLAVRAFRIEPAKD